MTTTANATHGKAIITCSITGVLTDPAQHPVPVSPEELAREARRACDAGASVVHVHFRQQTPAKVKDFIDVMLETGTLPEFECFDVGIVRCVEMYVQTGMYQGLPEYNFVMGVASGMPADPDLLPILLKLKLPGAPWQTTVIGRAEIWPVHRRTAELGGHLRSGLEDTFYMPDGSKVSSNAPLIGQLVQYAREAGREVASPGEARRMLGLAAALAS